MRVIAGTYGGLRLKTLKGAALRPTSDQLRETLFNILGESIEGARFLDAYAGSGAVGIEALSRGARSVTFLEQHRPAADLIRENLKTLGVDSGFEIHTCAVGTGIERLERQEARFDFVFLDPPYAEIHEYHRTLREFGRSQILAPAALVIAEHSRHCNLEERYGSLALARRLRHGDSQLAFYRRRSAGAE